MRYFNFISIFVLLLSTTTLSIYGRVFEKEEDCMIHENETIHEIMDRICEMCHEFASHSKPNMRFECRSQCFTTETFRTCLKLFTPKRHTRHNRRY